MSRTIATELENGLHSIEQTVARPGMEHFMPVVDAQGAFTRYPKFRWLFPVFFAIASAGLIGSGCIAWAVESEATKLTD